MPGISVGQTMWIRRAASTAIAGPFSGHPSSTQLSSLTRTGVENVRPPFRRLAERDVADVAGIDLPPRGVDRAGPCRLPWPSCSNNTHRVRLIERSRLQ